MNKKLILLPISLLPCLLTGCNNKDHIGIGQYFTFERYDFTHVLVNSEDQYDYNGVIRRILNKYVDKMNKQFAYSKGNNDPWMEYSFQISDGNYFSNFKVAFYDDGKINTHCDGQSLFSSKSQNTTYKINKEDLNKLKEEVIARRDEVNRIFEEEDTKAKEYTTAENFCNLLENPEDKDNCYIDTKFGKNTVDKRLKKFTSELISAMRDLEYEWCQDLTLTISDECLIIAVSKDWYMVVSSASPYANMFYTYGNTLTYVSLIKTFKISEEKKEVLINRCQEIIDNHNYTYQLIKNQIE